MQMADKYVSHVVTSVLKFGLECFFRREISKDWWHKSSDVLLKEGVKLTDGSGIHWRPRLGCC